jgi:hypothetical protein
LPFVLFKYGAKIRENSTNAVSDDEKEAKANEKSDTTETEKKRNVSSSAA